MSQPHILSVQVMPNAPDDQAKLSAALRELALQEPTCRARIHASRAYTTLTSTSELQLETVLNRLVEEYSIEARVSKPQVIYRETIRRSAEGEGRFTRQTPHEANYGHVKLRVSPNERGGGYKFTNDTRGGVVPDEYLRPISRSVRVALRKGVLAGYELVDVKVSLYDGSFHDLHSSKMAFAIAASMALKDAVRKANPVLLEPVMSVEVQLPEDAAGSIIADLNGRRGRIESFERVSGMLRLLAAVPLANALGYASTLRQLSQGRASCVLEFGEYKVRPGGADPEEDGPFLMAAVPRGPRPRGPYAAAMQQEPDAEL